MVIMLLFDHEYWGTPTGTIIDDSIDDAINRNSLHYTVSADSYIFGVQLMKSLQILQKYLLIKFSSVMTLMVK